MATERPPGPPTSAVPPPTARALAILSVLVGGLCGGLIGYAVADLEFESGTAAGIGALIGAVLGAAGVAVVAVLVLRAMAEWRTIEHTGQGRARDRVQDTVRRRKPSA
jgi:predicted lipid-binding transport protein (Tim44 family)